MCNESIRRLDYCCYEMKQECTAVDIMRDVTWKQCSMGVDLPHQTFFHSESPRIQLQDTDLHIIINKW